MQPPALERRSAVYKAQSLGSSLIHTIPAPHQRLPCLEDTALLFTRYQHPPQWSAVCRGLRSLTHSRWHGAPASVAHPLASSKAAPANESYYETAHKSEESPDAQKSARRRGVTWCPCAEKRAKARSHLVPLRGKSARRREVTWCPCAEKCAKAISHLVPLRAKAGSHLMPLRRKARRRGVTWCLGAHPISLQDFAGLLRQLFTPLRSGVQLGRIA